MSVETMDVVSNESSEITVEEKKDIINQMRSLLSTISNSAKEANNTLEATVNKIDKNEIDISKGISLLDVKYQMNIMYLSNLAYLMLKKINSNKIENDSAIMRLIEFRTILEKIKPLEQKLKYQIDKYLKIAMKGETDPNDPTNFKANPDLMNDDSDDNDEDEGTKKKNKEEKTNIYKPPRLSSVHYDGDETKNEKNTRAIERARKRALQSNLMQELKEEFLDKPIEYSHMSTMSLKNVQSEKERERQDYEETYFTRLPIQKKGNKKLSLTLNSIGDQVTKFEDISVLHGGDFGSGEGRGGKRKKKSMTPKKGKGKKKRKF